MKYTYLMRGTCAQQVEFDIEGDIISNISFRGGCSGNLKAIASLVDGMSVQEIADKLKGNVCGAKSTSCADQLAKAVIEAVESIK